MKQPSVKSMKRQLKKYVDETPKKELVKEIKKRQHLQEFDNFIETGVVPTLPPKERMADALVRCLWLLESDCAKESLKGYDLNFVIQYAKEALNAHDSKPKKVYGSPKPTGTRYNSVRDMLIGLNCSQKVIKRFDKLVAKMPAVYDETGKMLGFVHLDTDEFEPVTFKQFKNQLSKEMKVREKESLFKKQS